MQKTLIIVTVCGIVVMTGIAVYMNEKKKRERIRKQEQIKKDAYKETAVSVSSLNKKKSDTAFTISERHSEAAQIISEMLKEENNQIRESRNKVVFDEIDSSLESLLDEE